MRTIDDLHDYSVLVVQYQYRVAIMRLILLSSTTNIWPFSLRTLSFEQVLGRVERP